MTDHAGLIAKQREDDIAVAKAMNALEALGEIWAEETDLRGYIARLTSDQRTAERLLDLMIQGFIEGAYRGRESVTECPPHGFELVTVEIAMAGRRSLNEDRAKP